MADYRLSSQIITRTSGKSAVAAAAYRAADRLEDERTGVHHDYSRKSGVIHSEILTPANTPVWMHDRAQLWNAVEAVEKRKNSQLAREIQLSLPHELTSEQRTALVREFVTEQFTARGMIADVNIHSPNPKGDERNHHAHIMLTMRELTADGFHSKKSTPTARSWNDKELLATWRERWANHQNQALEKYGHSARVDHRSYEAQGVDREPQYHLGTAANDMLVKGKQSRIESDNQKVRQRNANRASLHASAAQVAAAMSEGRKTTAQQWAERKKQELSAQKNVDQKELARQHSAQQKDLAIQQAEKYNIKTLNSESQAIDKRLSSTGFRKVVRDLTGATKRDESAQKELDLSINEAKKKIEKERHDLKVRQAEESMKMKRDQRQKEAQIQQELKKRASAEFHRDFNRARNEPAQKKAAQEQKETERWETPQPKPKPPEEARKIAQQWKEHMGNKPANQSQENAQGKKQTSGIKEKWKSKKREEPTMTPKPPTRTR